jgi:hypothetical protein
MTLFHNCKGKELTNIKKAVVQGFASSKELQQEYVALSASSLFSDINMLFFCRITQAINSFLIENKGHMVEVCFLFLLPTLPKTRLMMIFDPFLMPRKQESF